MEACACLAAGYFEVDLGNRVMKLALHSVPKRQRDDFVAQWINALVNQQARGHAHAHATLSAHRSPPRHSLPIEGHVYRTPHRTAQVIDSIKEQSKTNKAKFWKVGSPGDAAQRTKSMI